MTPWVCDFIQSNDRRLVGGILSVLLLWDTKRSSNEVIFIRSPLIDRLLRHLVRHRQDLNGFLFKSFNGSAGRLRHLYYRGLEWAGIVNGPFVFHGIRHGAAGHARLLGVPLHVIQSWLRHRDVNTTLHYCDYLRSELLAGSLPLGSSSSLLQVESDHFCSWFGIFSCDGGACF